MTKLTIEQIAKACHEANREYCKSIGDPVKPSWEEAPENQRVSCIKGVTYHLTNLNSTPGDSHNEWMAEKLRTGWRYGEKFDEIAMTHPNLVVYDCLSSAQKAKDYIFREIARQLGSLEVVGNLEDKTSRNYGAETIDHNEPIVGDVDLAHQDPDLEETK